MGNTLDRPRGLGSPILPEPKPIHNNHPAVWDLVIADMRDRDLFGRKRYGTPLQPFNGRNALLYVYQVTILATIIYDTLQRNQLNFLDHDVVKNWIEP